MWSRQDVSLSCWSLTLTDVWTALRWRNTSRQSNIPSDSHPVSAGRSFTPRFSFTIHSPQQKFPTLLSLLLHISSSFLFSSGFCSVISSSCCTCLLWSTTLSPFSVAVLLSSPSLGRGDRLTETNALHGSYLHGKGWLNTTLTLTAGLKDVSYLVNLLQSPLRCCCLRECVNHGWHENELWGAMSWEPAKGGILSSLKWGFSLMLRLVSVPEAWDAFLWGGGMSEEHGRSEDFSGASLEFILSKSRTQWDGTVEMSWEVISQTRSFLRAIMSQGLVIASQLSSSWSLTKVWKESLLRT